mgnify:CR=1 FL=1
MIQFHIFPKTIILTNRNAGKTESDTSMLYATTRKLVIEFLHTSDINMTTLLQNQQTIQPEA